MAATTTAAIEGRRGLRTLPRNARGMNSSGFMKGAGVLQRGCCPLCAALWWAQGESRLKTEGWRADGKDRKI